MKFDLAFGPALRILDLLKLGFRPFFGALFANPSLLLKPGRVADLFFSTLWRPLGDGIDQNTASIKTALITPYASGVVLDCGAGHGHVIKYLDKSKVKVYVALEPNVAMHDLLRVAAAKEGYTESEGSLLILALGAEDLVNIGAQLKAHDIEAFDTIISVLSFCSVPNAKTSVPALIQTYLKPGGELLFFEHVRSQRQDVQWYQDAWVPVWRLFIGGCVVGQPTDDWIDSMDCWAVKDRKGIDSPEEEESLFPHRIGHYVKG